MEYSIEYRRRKTVEIRIDKQAKIRVIAPLGYTKGTIAEFIRLKEDWISKTVENIKKQKAERDACLNSIQNGGFVHILGKRHDISVEIIKEEGCKEKVVIEEGKVKIRSKSRAKAAVKGLLENCLREMAREIIGGRIRHYEKQINVKHNSFRIKSQKTRWGSCSSKGNLNFNFKIVMAPIEIIDYIVVHELCHLVNMDHSSHFWGLVASVIPDYSERRLWLREKGFILDL